MEDRYSLWLCGTYSLIGEKHQIMNDATNYLVKIFIIAITRITGCFERGPQGRKLVLKGAFGVS